MNTQDVLKCLNEAFRQDPNAIHALLVNRVPCNDALADHMHIQVDQPVVLDRGCYQVGMLGIINGLLGSCGEKLVAAMWSSPEEGVVSESGQVHHKLMGFCEYQPT